MKKINPNILAILFVQIVCAIILAIGAQNMNKAIEELACLNLMILSTWVLTELAIRNFNKKK